MKASKFVVKPFALTIPFFFVQWFLQEFYKSPDGNLHGEPNLPGALHCQQQAGEVIWVPTYAAAAFGGAVDCSHAHPSFPRQRLVAPGAQRDRHSGRDAKHLQHRQLARRLA